MSTGDSEAGKTAPHLASSIDTLYMGTLWEERHIRNHPQDKAALDR